MLQAVCSRGDRSLFFDQVHCLCALQAQPRWRSFPARLLCRLTPSPTFCRSFCSCPLRPPLYSVGLPSLPLVAASDGHTHCSAPMQVALKTDQLGVVYFEDAVPITALVASGAQLTPAEFSVSWESLPSEVRTECHASGTVSVESVKVSLTDVCLLIGHATQIYQPKHRWGTSIVMYSFSFAHILTRLRCSASAGRAGHRCRLQHTANSRWPAVLECICTHRP